LNRGERDHIFQTSPHLVIKIIYRVIYQVRVFIGRFEFLRLQVGKLGELVDAESNSPLCFMLGALVALLHIHARHIFQEGCSLVGDNAKS
jgi:hypothetical protein